LLAEAAGEPRAGAFEYAPEVTWEVGWKVAPPWKPPEATGRDFQGAASMKNPQQKQQKGLGSVGKALTTCGASLALACTGPQVRPEPPAEPCPPGAVEAMDKLDIDIGDEGGGVLLPGPPRTILSVREGWASITLGSAFGDQPPNTILKGRLFLGGERVYGRFTQARDYAGTRTWPVCMELADTSGNRGLELKPGSTADTAKVFSSVDVIAVDHFK
jgi:hypothetical protein